MPTPKPGILELCNDELGISVAHSGDRVEVSVTVPDYHPLSGRGTNDEYLFIGKNEATRLRDWLTQWIEWNEEGADDGDA